mgnify:CR=1 FL=1
MAVQYPVIGQWFRKPNGTLFEVVANDESEPTTGYQDPLAFLDEL